MVRVTKQRIDGVDKRIRENIEEINEFLESEKIDQGFYDKTTMLKAKIEKNLEKFKKLIDRIESQGSDTITEEYEESQGDAEERILDLQVLIMNYKEKQQVKIQLEEEKRQMETREKERQMEINAEVEKEKLQIEERIQVEKINLEQLKLEFNSKKYKEKIEAEIRCTEIESGSTNSHLQEKI